MIIAFSGPSGIGKGYIKEQLLRLYPNIRELTWFTTRLLRLNEQDGGNRIHVPVSEFNRMAGAGELVLVQNLFGHSYGLRVEDLLPTQDIRLTELHPDNMSEALKINRGIIAIGFVTFELPLLRKRLTVVRKTESPAEIEQRVATAKGEIETLVRLRGILTSVIEITEASEHLVFNEVLKILNQHLKKEGNHAN